MYLIRSIISLTICVLIGASKLAHAEQPPIKVGVILGFSGAAQAWGKYGRMGLEMARDEINAAGGIHGRPLELIFEDSKTNPMQSVTAYKKLVKVDKVGVVIGDVWEFLTNPLIPLAGKDKVLLISPTVMDASVETQNDYFYTMGQSIESIRDAVDLFFAKNTTVKTAAILCWDDPWGLAHVKLWKESAQKHGVTITSETCQNNFASDFRSDVTKIARERPDVVIVAVFPNRVLERMKEQKLDAKLLTTSDMVEAIYVRKASPALLEGAYFTNWEAAPDFVERFEQRFGEPPILEAHNHFETLWAVARAYLEKERDLLTAIKKVKYEGVQGPIDFSSHFPNKGPGKLYQVSKEGKPVLVQ